MDSEQIAKIQHELMQSLGYKQYVVQGGDWELQSANGWQNSFRILYWNSPKYGDCLATIRSNPMKNVSEAEKELINNYEKYKGKWFLGFYEIQKQNHKP
ncbi:MAG: hypothetical protein CM15mP108_2620 [Gammaproteobacteria bacterium]|nr:MAG: hypothetical protein CM15mP108_2620 [Gammaproteobacteria bacterium]